MLDNCYFFKLNLFEEDVMDVRSYISKLLVLPKSATFLMFAMFCLQFGLEAASCCPPGL